MRSKRVNGFGIIGHSDWLEESAMILTMLRPNLPTNGLAGISPHFTATCLSAIKRPAILLESQIYEAATVMHPIGGLEGHDSCQMKIVGREEEYGEMPLNLP